MDAAILPVNIIHLAPTHKCFSRVVFVRTELLNTHILRFALLSLVEGWHLLGVRSLPRGSLLQRKVPGSRLSIHRCYLPSFLHSASPLSCHRHLSSLLFKFRPFYPVVSVVQNFFVNIIFAIAAHRKRIGAFMRFGAAELYHRICWRELDDAR